MGGTLFECQVIDSKGFNFQHAPSLSHKIYHTPFSVTLAVSRRTHRASEPGRERQSDALLRLLSVLLAHSFEVDVLSGSERSARPQAKRTRVLCQSQPCCIAPTSERIDRIR